WSLLGNGSQRPHQAEAQVVVLTIVRLFAVAVPWSVVRIQVAPTAAPIHAVRARSRPLRIGVWNLAIVVLTKPILTPFPYISIHIIKPPCIRMLLPYWMYRISSKKRRIPSH